MAVLFLPLASALATGSTAAQTGVVARAAGMELGVEEAAWLLAARGEHALPAAEADVAGLAECWADYTLLVAAVAEDPTLARVNLDRVVARHVEEAMIATLLEREVRVDTAFTDAEVRAAWKEANPGARDGPPAGFRRQLAYDRWEKARRRFADSAAIAAGLRVQPGAAAVYRALWRRGGSGPPAFVLASYRGGELAAAEEAEGIRTLPPFMRRMPVKEPGDSLEARLRHAATRKILVLRARERGIETEPALVEFFRGQVRSLLAETVEQAGLAGKRFPAAGPARDSAIRAHVRALVQRVEVDRETAAYLGALSWLLHKEDPGRVFPGTYPAVVARVRAIRAARP
jgi:hypothetical protein